MYDEPQHVYLILKQELTVKSEFPCPIHEGIRIQGGSTGRTPLILNFTLWSLYFLDRMPVHIECEVWRETEPVWKLWLSEKNLLIWPTFERLFLDPVDHRTLLRYAGPIEADSDSVIQYKP